MRLLSIVLVVVAFSRAASAEVPWAQGVTKDNQGKPRPLIPRSFSTLSQAEEENGQSRIYLGIHWSFDKTEGIAQGRRVADFVFNNAFRPAR